ncbi:unnamed protein product [Ectocarpus sp. 6 AP-2014]
MSMADYHVCVTGETVYADRLSWAIMKGDLDFVQQHGVLWVQDKHLRLAVMAKQPNKSIITLIYTSLKLGGFYNPSDAMDYCRGAKAVSIMLDLGADPSCRTIFTDEFYELRGRLHVAIGERGDSFREAGSIYEAFETRILGGGEFPDWLEVWFDRLAIRRRLRSMNKSKDTLLRSCFEWHSGKFDQDKHFKFLTKYCSYKKYLPVRLLFNRIKERMAENNTALRLLGAMGTSKAMEFISARNAQLEKKINNKVAKKATGSGGDEHTGMLIRFSLKHDFFGPLVVAFL